MRDVRAARERAAAIVEELGIREPSALDLELIAAHHNVFVRYRALRGHEGHLVRTDRTGLVVVDERARGTPKARFVIAHELGHFLLHPTADQFHLCTSSEAHAWYRTSGLEAQANAFAGELLFPSALFDPLAAQLAAPSWAACGALARAFSTSRTAAAIRLVRSLAQPAALVCVRRGRVYWIKRTASFIPKIQRGRAVSAQTAASEAASQRRSAPGACPIAPDAWSKTLRARDLALWEEACWIESAQCALSWLWHA